MGLLLKHWLRIAVTLIPVLFALLHASGVLPIGVLQRLDDIVFAEPDDSSGLSRLRQLAQAELKDQPGFTQKLGQLQASLDYDAVFAKSLQKRPVVMGYYLTNDKDGRTSGVLPEPVMQKES